MTIRTQSHQIASVISYYFTIHLHDKNNGNEQANKRKLFKKLSYLTINLQYIMPLQRGISLTDLQR
jgi:hypothetical protein